MRGPVSRIALALAAVLGAAAAGAPPRAPASVVDAKRDPRLAQRLLLRSQGLPLTHVFRRLSAKTGVTLNANGRPGDERLVAFAPDASLAEIMQAVEDLYRLHWQK